MGRAARLLLLAGLLACVPDRARAAVTAITFTITHADCSFGANLGDGFRLYVNDVLVATPATTQACVCNHAPLVVRLSDPATLAAYDPSTCNAFRIEPVGVDVLVSVARMAGVPCIPSSGTPIVDQFADLPGPNGMSFPAKVQLVP